MLSIVFDSPTKEVSFGELECGDFFLRFGPLNSQALCCKVSATEAIVYEPRRFVADYRLDAPVPVPNLVEIKVKL